jgi:hypothetical protein
MSDSKPSALQCLSLRKGRVEIELAWVRAGRDLSVTLSGGDLPHIGAVAVSQPRPSHVDGGGTSASTSVITLPGHKEDELARAAAARLAAALDTNVCVACGIHMDDITLEEIVQVRVMAGELVEQLVVRLKG